MSYSCLIREEELKNIVAEDWFRDYDTTHVLGDVDFAVARRTDAGEQRETEYLFWAEAKKGTRASMEEAITQLILTIGKARTFESHMPPKFIGAFDAEKIVFLPYGAVQEVFYRNDFNWNITPSNYNSKEFGVVRDIVEKAFSKETYSFGFGAQKKELARFIKNNFRRDGKKISGIKISRNNFVVIYQKWLREVKPSIVVDWEAAKIQGVFDSDFYLADLLSEDNNSIMDRLQVLLRKTRYELNRGRDGMGLFNSSSAMFNDGQKAHAAFWNRYDRPPKKEYWDYIINRKDLLVPQDIRERQGSFFTPQKWVELSQQYLEAELGQDWQDEYYVWDCAAGTGNLLNGLTDKYRVWASTLNQADVDVMHERIENGANLLHDHVFRFDFLNDSFDDLPPRLREIVEDENLRKKLVIYINPPFAEAANKQTVAKTGSNKTNVALTTIIHGKYKASMGIAGRELFAQFMIRVCREIQGSVLASFSKLKNLQAPNFSDFRHNFRGFLSRIFIVPADTFDNVSGKFPISFQIWRLDGGADEFDNVVADVYDAKGNKMGTKEISANNGVNTINDWIISTRRRKGEMTIGYMSAKGCDFQNVNYLYIVNSKNQLPHPRGTEVTSKNLIEIGIYFAVRKVIAPTWMNDRDQFLYPNDRWTCDSEFQGDCLVYTLFSVNISSKHGVNHWIPFTEKDVNPKDMFKSHFMTDFIFGRQDNLFSGEDGYNDGVFLSREAKAVLDAGKELWSYYHCRPDSDPDASLYDIKLYFQGMRTMKNGKTKMNPRSDDANYTDFIDCLRERLKTLAAKIEPKVYEYGFLHKWKS